MAATAPALVRVALRNVLVATDFSPCSERALLHAVSVALHFGSTLHLVHVLPSSSFSFVPPEGYAGTSEAVVRAISQARTEAEACLHCILGDTRCRDLKHRVWIENGSIEATLRSIIECEHIDLAVVGTHGRTGLRKFFLGSVAENVFRYSACPVLTVGPHAWQSDAKTARLKQVLFPTDFSMDSQRALPFVMAIAAEFGADLILLHVVEHLEDGVAHDWPRTQNALKERMREMVADAGRMPPGTEFLVELGNIPDVIIETAARIQSDLLAFGLKAPDTLVDRLPWMHAYRVVCEVRCPVLSVRGPSGWSAEQLP